MASAHGGWRIGEATITPVYETDAGTVIQAGMPEATPERLSRIPWLRPHFADGAGRMFAVVQTFVIKLGGESPLLGGMLCGPVSFTKTGSFATADASAALFACTASCRSMIA